MHKVGDLVSTVISGMTCIGTIDYIATNPATQEVTCGVNILHDIIQLSPEVLKPYKHAHISNSFSRRANAEGHSDSEDI